MPESQFGRALVVAGDVNGNGTRDLIIGGYPARLHVVDGATRETIYTLVGNTDRFIRSDVDWTGDGVPELLINTLIDRSLVSGAAIGTSVIGRGCARSGEEVPRIGSSGPAHLNEDFRVHLSGVEPDDRALLLIGSPGAALFGEPIARAPWDCAIGVAVQDWMRAEVETVRPGEGAVTARLPIPDDASLVGSGFDLQWLVLEGHRGRGVKALTRILHVEIQAAVSARATPRVGSEGKLPNRR